MKKIIIAVLLLCPSLVSANTEFGYFLFDAPSVVYINDKASVNITTKINNNTYPGDDGYYQLKLWLDDWNSVVCGDVRGPVTFTAPDVHLDTFDLSAYGTIVEIDILHDSNGSLDGDGCLDASTAEYFYSADANDDGAIILDMPSAEASEMIVNNPTLDWFFGFMIFFICMIFPIWLFRRK